MKPIGACRSIGLTSDAAVKIRRELEAHFRKAFRAAAE
jgi:hypothetical protein